MGYRGKVEQQEQARRLRAENLTLAEIADAARRQQVLGLPLGARRPLHPLEAPPRRPPPPAPAAPREARARSRSCDAAGRGADRRARPTTRSSPPVSRSTRARARRRDDCVTFANTDPAMIALLLRLAPALLRHRRGAAAGPRLPARGPRPRCRRGASGRRSPASRAPSSEQPYRAVADPTHPAQQARARVRVRRVLVLADPSTRSWVWCGLCYRQTPFRGSSIGRAAAC